MFKSLFLAFGLFSSTFCILTAAENTTNASSLNSGTILAEVDGTKLTLADFDRKHPTGLFQARNTFFDAHRKAAEQFVDEYLLERQAQKESITVDQLLERHVNNTLPKNPSDEALRVFYEGIETTEPYEKVKEQIIQAIRDRRMAKAKTAYLQTLRSEAKVILRVGPPRAEVTLKDTPLRGASDAPVVLVEYADYECPYCQQIAPTLEKLQAEFKGKMAFAYKDVPLPMHANAQKAAEATHCAGTQGKFWEYHDLLFSSKQLTVPQLKNHARELKLDAKTFDQCLDSGEQAQLIKTQYDEGQGLGIQGTPTFFINGRFIGGGKSLEDFRRIVEEEISVTQRMNTAKR